MVSELKGIDVVAMDGSRKETVEIDVTGVCASKNGRRVSDVAVMYLANQKKRTASTKGRSEVTASGKKQRKQKGLGRARAGNAASPIWVGGGRAFGPKPRDVRFDIPRKMKRRALIDALLLKIKDQKVTIVEELKLEQPKTRELVKVAETLRIEDGALFVTAGCDRNLVLSARNIPKTDVAVFKDLNALDVISHDAIVFTRKAFESVKPMLGA
jgi:large subunit ribosomal protein L4